MDRRVGSSERLAVVGAGAMGCIFGAALAEAGLDVTLLDVSRPLVDRINEAGVTVVRDGVERTASVPATDDPATIGPVDAAILFVKCYQTEAADGADAPARRRRVGRRVASERLGKRIDPRASDRRRPGRRRRDHHSGTSLGPAGSRTTRRARRSSGRTRATRSTGAALSSARSGRRGSRSRRPPTCAWGVEEARLHAAGLAAAP